MPDLLEILHKRWRLIAGLTLAAMVVALAVSLIRSKEFRSTVTALPANSVLTDKSRIFNTNIEALYPELGNADELERIEGTAQLDTIFLAVAQKHGLVSYYVIEESLPLRKAAQRLQKAADIRRSAYGELKISVWDKDPFMAAQLANALLNELNELHQHIRTANNQNILKALQKGLEQKERAIDSLEQSITSYQSSSMQSPGETRSATSDSNAGRFRSSVSIASLQKSWLDQVNTYRELIQQYELALSTSQQPLIVVEAARPSLQPDRPKVLQTLLFAFGATLIFSFLLAVFMESRYRHGNR